MAGVAGGQRGRAVTEQPGRAQRRDVILPIVGQRDGREDGGLTGEALEALREQVRKTMEELVRAKGALDSMDGAVGALIDHLLKICAVPSTTWTMPWAI